MHMNYIALIATTSMVFAFVFFSCSNAENSKQKVSEDKYNDLPKIQIHSDSVRSLNTNDFVELVEYLPLETNTVSQFSEVSQIETIGDCYAILDRLANEILFFRKDDKFVSKISPQNKDILMPYKAIENFTVDLESEILSFQDQHSAHVYDFDLSGNFVKMREKYNFEHKVRESYFINGYKLDYFSYDKFGESDTISPNITIRKNGTIIETYLQFNPSIIDHTDVYSAQKYFFKSPDDLLFCRPYDYTVYRFDVNGKMCEYLKIDLPEELRLPSDFISGTEYTGNRRAYTNANSHKPYLITDVYKVGDVLSLKLFGAKYTESFLYDSQKKTLIDLRKYLSDSSTHYLPIAGANIIGVDNDKLISFIASKELIQIMNRQLSIPDFMTSLPDHLKEFYKKGGNQNPILLLTKLKKSINYERGS